MKSPQHFQWRLEGKVGVITLNRPERKNPLTFESYAELRDFFGSLKKESSVKSIVLTGAGGNFCSGGDVHEIIGPLTRMALPQLLEFTRMTGNLVKAMRHCPQPVIAAVDGVCAGAGAILAMAADLRYAAPNAKVALGAPRSCSTPGVPWMPTKGSPGDSSTASGSRCSISP